MSGARLAGRTNHSPDTPLNHSLQLSIVVVTHNEGELLRQTVVSLLESVPTANVEIIVVDDQSTDGSTAFLSEPGWAPARLVTTPSRLGISPARNLGAAHAAGDVVVFSDAHVEAYRGWAEPLYLAAVKPFVGEVAPVVHSLREPHIKGFGFTWREASLKMHWLRRTASVAYPVPFLCGCFVALRRELFRDIGGFDDGLIRWGSEDAELSLRLWRMGYECQVVPASAVAHLFRKRFPYEVSWDGIIHNTLRLATVHFGDRALSRVLAFYRTHAAFAGHILELGVDHVLFFDALFLDLDEETVRAEDFGVSLRDRAGELCIAFHECGADFATEAGAGGNQAFAELAQNLFVDARLVIKPFAKCDAR